jgi:two-component system, sensor histidine kinase
VRDGEGGADHAESGADPRQELRKLRKINAVLMNRVERATDLQGGAFSMFQAAIVLEGRVEERSLQLETALRQVEAVNTDLTRAKEQAETARRRLREAIDSISEGFALFDADDRLMLWNDEFVDLLALLGQDVVAGMHFAQVIRVAVERDTVRDAIGREEEWVALRLAHHRHPQRPFVYRLADGRWLQVNERRTQEGGTVAVYTDITDIKVLDERRRQKELAEKSEVLQATLESLGQGVAVFDRDLRLVAWNQRYFDLHRFPRVLAREGTPYADFLRCNAERGDYGAGDIEALIAEKLRTVRQALPRAFERTLADGRVVEISSNPMPDGGFVNTYTDITERKRADLQLRDSERRLKRAARELARANETLERRVEQRTAELSAVNEALREAKGGAERANLSKTKFLAAASHDLLQPLNAARLFAATLGEYRLGSAEREVLLGIDNALEAIDALLRTLFDISKLDAGVMAAEPAVGPIGPLLEQLAREYQPQARAAGLELRFHPSRAAIESDMRLLARVLRNFLANAIRYTDRGRVVLGCRRRGGMLSIEVWDTGIGIAPDKLGMVFQEFQQIAVPGRRRDKSLGLGLAIVERIARLLGHPVRVQSVPGRGSCFAIEVPVRARERGADGTPASNDEPVATPGSLAGLSVVVIDDDEEGLAAISALLRAWGGRVTALRSAGAVDAWLDGNPPPPRLVVADYHLGDGVDGAMLIERLRWSLGVDMPACVVTSDQDPALRIRLRDRGLPLIAKPVAPARLRALIAHLIGPGAGRG